MKILAAEDDLGTRIVLERFLRNEGHEVSFAATGREAVDLFRREMPDLILMDAVMPEMNGYEAAHEIRSVSRDRYVPIVFVTGNETEQDLVRCVECGGDDFVTKPFSPAILGAKLAAHARQSELRAALQRQTVALEEHRSQLVREQTVARGLFERIVHSGGLHAENLRYVASSLSIFNGDLLLVARRPEVGQNLLVGDFSGCGLPAAVGAIPVARTFYAMTAKGYPMAAILAEINRQLVAMLPAGVYLSAVGAEIDELAGRALVWNGGMPDVLVRGPDGLRATFPSEHLPLGVVDDATLRLDLRLVELRVGDTLYVHTDGLLHAKNALGEEFGAKRLRDIVDAARGEDWLVEQIEREFEAFLGSEARTDDVTLLEVRQVGSPPALPASPPRAREPAWRSTFSFDANALRRIDPLPHLVVFVAGLEGLEGDRQSIQTVLAELYANALDHGVLGLDSALKKSPEGFAAYYVERDARLRGLEDGQVICRIAHEAYLDDRAERIGGRIVIEVEDSGPGFDFARVDAPAIEENLGLCGRGIPLVRSLCGEVAYLGRGNLVRVAYEWPRSRGARGV